MLYHSKVRWTFSGHYNVNETLVHKSSLAASASFKSATERKMTSTPDHSPGPGSYSPYQAKKEKPRGYKFQ